MRYQVIVVPLGPGASEVLSDLAAGGDIVSTSVYQDVMSEGAATMLVAVVDFDDIDFELDDDEQFLAPRGASPVLSD